MTFIKTHVVRLFLLFAVTMAVPCFAQEKPLEEAEEFYKHKNYGAALPLIEEQLKKTPDNALLNYQAGVCYLHSRSLKSRAAGYLEKAVEHSPYLRTKANPGPTDAPQDAIKLLGDAYTYAFKFDHALRSYEQYKTLVLEKDKNNALLPEVDLRIEMCRHLKDYRPSQTIPLSAKTGSPCGDLVQGNVTSTISPDKNTIIYTLRVPVNKVKQQDESSRYFEDTDLVPAKDTSAKKKTTKNPVKELVERDTVVYATTVGTSHDGQVVLTYKNDEGDGNIYISRLRDNRWSSPARLKESANKAGWEPYESLSADGNYLYFASDRPGGYGGWDLYRCRKEADGQWSKAVNLGPAVNTAADELAPFIYADGITLFFSSNRVKPGSYDIFAATASSGANWEKPLNVGYPINRNARDIFQVTADNKMYGAIPEGTGTAVKKDSIALTLSPGRKVFRPERDNYLITFTGKQKIPLNLRRGTVTDNKGDAPVPADISVIDNRNGAIQGVYHADEQTGQFAIVIPSERSLQVVYEAKGYLPVSEHINLKNDDSYFEEYKAVKLEPLKPGATVTLSNVFFDEDKTAIAGGSDTELRRTIKMLKENQGMEIELTNLITTSENKRFYKHLSRARAREVKAFLLKEGISKKRVDASGTSKKPPKIKEPKRSKGKPKVRNPKPPEVPKPLQVLKMKITAVKDE